MSPTSISYVSPHQQGGHMTPHQPVKTVTISAKILFPDQKVRITCHWVNKSKPYISKSTNQHQIATSTNQYDAVSHQAVQSRLLPQGNQNHVIGPLLVRKSNFFRIMHATLKIQHDLTKWCDKFFRWKKGPGTPTVAWYSDLWPEEVDKKSPCGLLP